MKNRALKVECIEKGYVEQVKKLHNIFNQTLDYSGIEDWISNHSYEEYKETLRVWDSSKKRIGRIWRYIYSMLQHNCDGEMCVFITLTFTDLVLNETTYVTRRKYVSRFLKDNCIVYLANIDFGDPLKNPDSNEREHYHAVAVVDHKIDMKLWEYGFSWISKTRCSVDDAKRLSKYVDKMTNHALKESTHDARLIYSKNLKKFSSSVKIAN